MKMGSGAWALLRRLCASPDKYHEPTEGWRALVHYGYARGDYSGVAVTEDGLDLMSTARAVLNDVDSAAYHVFVCEALSGMTIDGRQSKISTAALITAEKNSPKARDHHAIRIAEILRAAAMEGIEPEQAQDMIKTRVFRKCKRCHKYRLHHKAGKGKTRPVCRECTAEARAK
jgi:hypothetical protein